MKRDLFRGSVFGRRVGLIFNTRAVWIGLHGSNHNRRFCFNLVPCLTFWICRAGGMEP